MKEKEKLIKKLNNKLRNNDGASIVMVMLVTAIISTIITVILLLVLINYYMKATDVKANKNFYDAETAMEEIRLGMSVQFENSFSAAYQKALSDASSNDTSAQKKAFSNNLRESLYKTYESVNGSGLYLIDPVNDGSTSAIALSSYFKETKAVYEDGNLVSGARITTKTGENYIVKTSDGVILRNIEVNYLDENGFETTIRSDIKLSVPDVDFPGKSAIGDIYTYALVAQDHMETSGTSEIKIQGNTLFGSGDNKDAENKIKNTKVTFAPNGTNGYTIWGVPTKIENNEVNLSDMEIWAKDITLDKGTFNTAGSSRVYLQDDLVLGSSSHSSLEGGFYAFGNPKSALLSKPAVDKNASTGVLTEEAKDFVKDVENDPAKFSSAIIVNGAGSTLDLSKLNSLSISGTSYVDLVQNEGEPHITSSETSIVMGNSVSLKSDQRAYLVPSEIFGKGYENGGINPMTKEQYKKLRKEIAENKGYSSINDVTESDLVSLDTPLEILNGATLRSYGVTGVKEVFYQTTSGSMSYCFLLFSDSESAAKYYQTYIQYSQYSPDKNKYPNRDRLSENLNRYLGGGYNLSRQATTGNADFYLNGNVITDNSESVITMGYTSFSNQNLMDDVIKQEAEYQGVFYALQKKVIKSFDTLSDSEKKTELFYNIINKENIKSESWYPNSKERSSYVGLGIHNFSSVGPLNNSTLWFVDPATGCAAIIVEGNLTRSQINNKWSELKSSYGAKSFNLIIATGDVDLRKIGEGEEDRNNTYFGSHNNTFEGLIFSGGTIYVDQGMTLKSDPDNVLSAMNAKVADSISTENFTAADFFVDADYYRMGGIIVSDDTSTEETSTSSDTKLAMDYITYENWNRK